MRICLLPVAKGKKIQTKTKRPALDNGNYFLTELLLLPKNNRKMRIRLHSVL